MGSREAGLGSFYRRFGAVSRMFFRWSAAHAAHEEGNE